MPDIHCNHEINLNKYIARLTKQADKTLFQGIKSAYQAYRQVMDEDGPLDELGINQIVAALNEYRRRSLPTFDHLPNAGQKALGYTIMEEFFYLLFKRFTKASQMERPGLFLGKGNSYVSLSFTPKSFTDVFADVKPYIHTKDQDFILGLTVNISVATETGNPQKKQTILPIVAIECKTYLERNMLDSCANTASRLKRAMPYCIYMVAAEYMKMDEATPELTDIDEVYILCRARNAERERRKKNGELPLDIDATLIRDLIGRVDRHLKAVWWSPDDAVSAGKIIRRP